jgi:hypothetical protein
MLRCSGLVAIPLCVALVLGDSAARAEDARAETMVTVAATVHIDSPRSVVLTRLYPDDTWRWVCDSPCDAAVMLDGAYRIEGRDVRPREVNLVPHDGRVVLRVNPGRKSGTVVGGVIAALGYGAITVGAMYLLASLWVSAAAPPGWTTRDDGASMTVATIASVGGVVALTGVLVAEVNRTRVTTLNALTRTGTSPPTSTAKPRQPEWRGTTANGPTPKMRTMPGYAWHF